VVAGATADEAIVYNIGALYGEWPDGTAFDGNRYVDRFVVSRGKIVRMDVWNDSAEILLCRRMGARPCPRRGRLAERPRDGTGEGAGHRGRSAAGLTIPPRLAGLIYAVLGRRSCGCTANSSSSTLATLTSNMSNSSANQV